MTYTVYTDNGCTQGAVDAGTKTVTNGQVPDSNAVPFNNAGTFFWQAVYSGDANNLGATSPCTSEKLVISPNSPSMTTAQNVIPNDAATISGTTANAGGTVTFSLFSPGDANCSGTPALTQTLNVNGNGTYKTTNSAFIASDTGEWRWQVIYSGDANNNGTTLACGFDVYEAWMGCKGIAVARSVNGGRSFEAPVSVPGTVGSNVNTWDPAVAVAPDGTVYVSFMLARGGQYQRLYELQFADEEIDLPAVVAQTEQNTG